MKLKSELGSACTLLIQVPSSLFLISYLDSSEGSYVTAY